MDFLNLPRFDSDFENSCPSLEIDLLIRYNAWYLNLQNATAAANNYGEGALFLAFAMKRPSLASQRK